MCLGWTNVNLDVRTVTAFRLRSGHIPLNRFAFMSGNATLQIVAYKKMPTMLVYSEVPSEIFCAWANLCMANQISKDAKFI